MWDMLILVKEGMGGFDRQSRVLQGTVPLALSSHSRGNGNPEGASPCAPTLGLLVGLASETVSELIAGGVKIAADNPY
jgi:hypothetical protein